MTPVYIRQMDIERMLREEFDAQPGCRVVDRDGTWIALFLDEESNSRATVNISRLAREIERRLS